MVAVVSQTLQDGDFAPSGLTRHPLLRGWGASSEMFADKVFQYDRGRPGRDLGRLGTEVASNKSGLCLEKCPPQCNNPTDCIYCTSGRPLESAMARDANPNCRLPKSTCSEREDVKRAVREKPPLLRKPPRDAAGR